MKPLQGVGVLVTRPEHQAAPLCRVLESAGASTRQFPVIDILPAADLSRIGHELGPVEAFELVIFTSANAVRFGAALLPEGSAPKIAAIGPATAEALAKAGYRVAATPGGGFDSESLLSHPLLAQPAGRRILLIKGTEGRDLLETQLTAQGAQVAVAAVYRRERVAHGAAVLQALQDDFAADRIQVITATSVEIAAAVLDIASAALQREFERIHWLVPGDRVVAALRGRGVAAPILKASTAAAQDLVAALVRWRSSVSGA